MSSSSPGRALPLPLTWGSSRPKSDRDDAALLRLSDEEAISRLQAADSSVLHLLFDRYSRLVLDVSLRVLRDRGEAEEIVQDVFFYVYRKANLFDPAKGLAKAWILHIAHHRALDRRAYLTRRGFYVGTEIDSLDDSLLGATDLDREVGANLSRAQLEKALKQLPQMQRRTLELYYFEGLELREIGEKLNEPLGNVRHHFYRGLERLRKSSFVRKLREK